MKCNFISIFLFSVMTSVCYSQKTENLDTSTLEINPHKNYKPKHFFEKEYVKIGFTPTLLFTGSALTWRTRKDIKDVRNRYIPTFKYTFDDYLQYVPAAATFGLKAAGVKGRNDFKRSAITYMTSMGIMTVLVNGIKYSAKVERPDGSKRNSFPSGHTAVAFANATFLDKEYGLVNAGYSIAGYGAATMTGVGRGLNNRHWVSDIFAGAGIGILSTQLAYFFIDKIYGNKGDNLSLLSGLDSHENPSFLSLKIGFAASSESLLESNKEGSLAKVGWEAGLEGAYFFHKNWGVGGEFVVTSFPIKSINLNDLDLSEEGRDAILYTDAPGYLTFSAGPYYNLNLSEKWSLTAKALIGYTIGAQGEIIVRNTDTTTITEDIIIANYKPKNTIQYTPGLSLTYHITDNIGISSYVDFSHSQSTYKFTYNPDYFEIDSNESNVDYEKSPFNYVSLGFRLTAFF